MNQGVNTSFHLASFKHNDGVLTDTGQLFYEANLTHESRTHSKPSPAEVEALMVH